MQSINVLFEERYVNENSLHQIVILEKIQQTRVNELLGILLQFVIWNPWIT